MLAVLLISEPKASIHEFLREVAGETNVGDTSGGRKYHGNWHSGCTCEALGVLA